MFTHNSTKAGLIVLLTALPVVNAGCTQTARFNDHLAFNCTDETTGLPFQYVDYNGQFENHDVKRSELDEIVYTTYHIAAAASDDPPSNVTLHEIRSLKSSLSDCWQGIKGICADDHVIGWTNNAGTWIGSIASMVSSINGNRVNQNPRSVCTNWGANGNMCVSWTVNNVFWMTDAQIKAMSNDCWNTCQSQGWSCEVSVKAGGQVEYFCLSNRATNCSKNSKIGEC